MKRLTLAEDVYQHLKQKIVSSDLLPGTSLLEEEIAAELEVSRTPVREALRTLEAEGLVEIQPRRSARVALISRQLILDAYEAREWVEPIVAARAASLIDEIKLEELETAVEKMPFDPRTHEAASVALQADIEFHDLICQVAGNPLIHTLIKDARAITQRAAYFVPPGRFLRSKQEHKAILNALRKRDPELAEKLMREHIVNARGRMIGSG